MRSKTSCATWWQAGLAVALCVVSARGGSIEWEQWVGVPGTSVEEFLESNVLDFPADFIDPITEAFDTFTVFESDDVDEEYASRIRGYIQAPESGDFQFFLRTDDAGQLFFSTNHEVSRKRLIAEETACCAPLFEGARIEQRRSAPMSLVKGQVYYVEVLHNEGFGSDYIEVGWQRPDGTQEHIPGLFLLRYAPENTSPRVDVNPADQFVTEGETAVFAVTVSVAQPARFQWLKNGTPIEGAICQAYVIPAVQLEDNGARYACEITAPGGAKVTSEAARLTVSSDSAPPALIGAGTRGNSNGVQVSFSEPVAEGVIDAPATYFSIEPGVTIHSAAFGETPNVVQLETSDLSDGTAYTLTVRDVPDRAASANLISPNPSSLAVSQAHGVITRRVYRDIPGRLLEDLTSHARFPDQPDVVDYPTVLETPAQVGDNYGVQFVGYFVPPVSGEYTFYISSGNEGALYLSSDDQAANKQRIAFENEAYIPPRQWVDETLRPEGENVSAPQTLTAGKRYYIEALMKAGAEFGGAGQRQDHLAVAVQMPGDPPPENGDPPIGGSLLSAFTATSAVMITTHPADASVEELRPVRLSVEVEGTPPYTYEWLKDGEVLAGEREPELFLPGVSLEDDGAVFSARVRNSFSEAVSAGATVSVRKDVTPPRISKVSALNVNTSVAVEFSEPIAQASAEDASNYVIDPGVSVEEARLLPDLKTVALTTTPLSAGVDYTLSVNAVSDRASEPNAIADGASRQFQFFGSGRVASELLALYTFQEGEGDTVHDWSGVGVPLDLMIEDTDHVSWLPDGGLSVNEETRIVSTSAARKISSAMRESNQLTVEVWTRSTDPDQDGPARIVTVSEGSGGGDRNFSLNQGMWNQNAPDSLRWSLRLSQNSSGGATWLTEVGTVDTERLQHVVATVDTSLPSEQAKIYVDGVEAGAFQTPGDFSDFADDRLLVFANENSLVGSGRRYLGELFLIALYDRALTPAEINTNFQVGPIEILVPEDEEPIELTISRAGAEVVIGWEGGGVLVSSPEVDGEYAPVAGASNPYTVTPQGTRFYRVDR